MKTYQELQDELNKLYEKAPSREQRKQITLCQEEYKEKAAMLISKYMKKEIAILKDIKLYLQNTETKHIIK